MKKIITGAVFLILAIIGIVLIVGSNNLPFLNQSRMKLESSAFKHNEPIPLKYTCDGANINPPLSFSNIPDTAVSLALVMDDHDIPKTVRPDGVWDHWVVWNVQPHVAGFQENSAPPGILGNNSSGSAGYQAPCPPNGEHRYRFTLYALHSSIDLPFGSTKPELLKAMEGKILEKATLVGKYKR